MARILASDSDGLGYVELLVVDDGSPSPAEDFLAQAVVPARFSLRVLRQSNSGPARARNKGFRDASGSIVLFMDDDILAPPSVLKAHVEAHRTLPHSVVFGLSPWPMPPMPGAAFRLLQSLIGQSPEAAAEFQPVTLVASGHLSVERAMFAPSEGVYRDDLLTPGAEEFELSARLLRRGVPVFLAHRILALHDSPVSIEGFSRQQFKHALGTAEAISRCPETLALPELARIMARNARQPGDSVLEAGAKALKELMSGPISRRVAGRAARIAELLAPQADFLAPFYRLVIALHYWGGIREGMARFRKTTQLGD